VKVNSGRHVCNHCSGPSVFDRLVDVIDVVTQDEFVDDVAYLF
jgi:hypothetical protein